MENEVEEFYVLLVDAGLEHFYADLVNNLNVITVSRLRAVDDNSLEAVVGMSPDEVCHLRDLATKRQQHLQPVRQPPPPPPPSSQPTKTNGIISSKPPHPQQPQQQEQPLRRQGTLTKFMKVFGKANTVGSAVSADDQFGLHVNATTGVNAQVKTSSLPSSSCPRPSSTEYSSPSILRRPETTIDQLDENSTKRTSGTFRRSATLGRTASARLSDRSSGPKTVQRLDASMISLPQNDFRHVGHVGFDGIMFGDVAFIRDNIKKFPIKVGSHNGNSRSGSLTGSTSSLPHSASRDLQTKSECSRYTVSALEGTSADGEEDSFDDFKLPDFSISGGGSLYDEVLKAITLTDHTEGIMNDTAIPEVESSSYIIDTGNMSAKDNWAIVAENIELLASKGDREDKNGSGSTNSREWVHRYEEGQSETERDEAKWSNGKVKEGILCHNSGIYNCQGRGEKLIKTDIWNTSNVATNTLLGDQILPINFDVDSQDDRGNSIDRDELFISSASLASTSESFTSSDHESVGKASKGSIITSSTDDRLSFDQFSSERKVHFGVANIMTRNTNVSDIQSYQAEKESLSSSDSSTVIGSMNRNADVEREKSSKNVTHDTKPMRNPLPTPRKPFINPGVAKVVAAPVESSGQALETNPLRRLRDRSGAGGVVQPSQMHHRRPAEPAGLSSGVTEAGAGAGKRVGGEISNINVNLSFFDKLKEQEQHIF